MEYDAFVGNGKDVMELSSELTTVPPVFVGPDSVAVCTAEVVSVVRELSGTLVLNEIDADASMKAISAKVVLDDTMISTVDVVVKKDLAESPDGELGEASRSVDETSLVVG